MSKARSPRGLVSMTMGMMLDGVTKEKSGTTNGE
jgi:hypothetical protein